MEIMVKTGTYTQVQNGEEKQITFNYFTDLTARKKMNFVNTVVDTIVTDNRYNGIIKDLVFDFVIIDVFTDVDVSEIRDSADTISAMEDFIASTNIVDIVIANVKSGVIDSLRIAVDENVQYKTGVNSNSITTALSRLLNKFEEKVEGIDMESMMNFAQVVGGVSGELTPNKILEAYVNTDMFKKNQADKAAARSEHIAKLTEIADKKKIK